VDVEAVAEGSEFVVVIEGTYWNGFRNSDRDSVSTYTYRSADKVKELGVTVLFPPEKPWKGCKCSPEPAWTSVTASARMPAARDVELRARRGRAAA